MAMYAVAVTPLINSLEDPEMKQVWFADDATAAENLTGLKRWWDRIVELGPAYNFIKNYINQKVSEWIESVEKLL